MFDGQPLCKIEALGEKRRLTPPATRTRAHNLSHRGEFLFEREEVLNPVGGSQLLFHLALGRLRGIGGLDELVHSDEGFLEATDASEASVAWMNLCTPTRAFLRLSKEEAYNIFFLILAESGHQFIRNSFCFFEDSVVPWH